MVSGCEGSILAQHHFGDLDVPGSTLRIDTGKAALDQDPEAENSYANETLDQMFRV